VAGKVDFRACQQSCQAEVAGLVGVSSGGQALRLDPTADRPLRIAENEKALESSTLSRA
jgi:hypothetical protein